MGVSICSRGQFGGNRVNNIDIGSRDSVAGQGNQRQTAGTRRIEPTNRANAFREADFKGREFHEDKDNKTYSIVAKKSKEVLIIKNNQSF